MTLTAKKTPTKKTAKTPVKKGPPIKRTEKPVEGDWDKKTKDAFENRVCIVWIADHRSGALGTLTFRPEGAVRTYDPDAIDERVGEHVVVKTMDEAVVALRDGHRVAVPVRVARGFGRDWTFM